MKTNLPKFSLDFQKVQQSLSDAIRDPVKHPCVAGVDERHLNIYRELFFNNVESFITGGFPVLMELFSEQQQTQLVRDFFSQHQCHSPYFLKISEEFLQYLPNSTLDFLPEFSYQLAHWEWMELYADVYQNNEVITPLTQLNFESDVLTLIETTWCQAYDYPVHKISHGNSPAEDVSYLMIYRDEQLQVGFNELNPLSALLFERLKHNTRVLADEMLQEIARQQIMDVEQVIQGGRQILLQWCELGILTSSPNS